MPAGKLPAGMGKSRLVECVLADEPDAVRSHCPAEADAPPLWLWLRIVARVQPPDSDREPSEGPADGTPANAAESEAARFRFAG